MRYFNIRQLENQLRSKRIYYQTLEAHAKELEQRLQRLVNHCLVRPIPHGRHIQVTMVIDQALLDTCYSPDALWKECHLNLIDHVRKFMQGRPSLATRTS